jgi:hypothetical protein
VRDLVLWIRLPGVLMLLFGQGSGSGLFVNGKLASTTPWFNLALQMPTPQRLGPHSFPTPHSHSLLGNAFLTNTVAYDGGSCVAVDLVAFQDGCDGGGTAVVELIATHAFDAKSHVLKASVIYGTPLCPSCASEHHVPLSGPAVRPLLFRNLHEAFSIVSESTVELCTSVLSRETLKTSCFTCKSCASDRVCWCLVACEFVLRCGTGDAIQFCVELNGHAGNRVYLGSVQVSDSTVDQALVVPDTGSSESPLEIKRVGDPSCGSSSLLLSWEPVSNALWYDVWAGDDWLERTDKPVVVISESCEFKLAESDRDIRITSRSTCGVDTNLVRSSCATHSFPRVK